MKKLVVVGVLALLIGCGREAVFQGKKTSAWIAQLKDKDTAVRQDAIRALGQMGPAVVPALVAALNDENSDVRIGAADSLGRLGAEAKSAAPALKWAIKDPDKEVRRHATFALGILDPEDLSVIPLMIEALRDNDLEVRRQAAVTLGRIGPPAKAALPALNDVFKNDKQEDPRLRMIVHDAITAISERPFN
jgi:HEAT repeat protein